MQEAQRSLVEGAVICAGAYPLGCSSPAGLLGPPVPAVRSVQHNEGLLAVVRAVLGHLQSEGQRRRQWAVAEHPQRDNQAARLPPTHPPAHPPTSLPTPPTSQPLTEPRKNSAMAPRWCLAMTTAAAPSASARLHTASPMLSLSVRKCTISLQAIVWAEGGGRCSQSQVGGGQGGR